MILFNNTRFQSCLLSYVLLQVARLLTFTAGAADSNATLQAVELLHWERTHDELHFALTIETTKKALHKNEPVEATIQIRNDSSRRLRVYAPGLHGRIEYVPNPGGRTPLSEPPMVFSRSAIKGQSDFIILEPKETFGRKLGFHRMPKGTFHLVAGYTEKPDAHAYVLEVRSAPIEVLD